MTSLLLVAPGFCALLGMDGWSPDRISDHYDSVGGPARAVTSVNPVAAPASGELRRLARDPRP